MRRVPAERPNRLRLSTIGAVAAITGMVFATGCQGESHTGHGTSSTTAPTRVVDTTPVVAVWAVPQAFLGVWRGIAVDGPVTYEITLTINSGKNAEEVALSSVVDNATGNRCDRIERLFNASETELSFTGRTSGGTVCGDGAKPSTAQLRPDGTLAYTADRPTVSGTLRKS
ncbi:hypothetical protein [Nocardia sp. NPDC052566]|uniref:hypothetical protein n=1 Tax=Nocardia sp. NPDC052566 TaxID=3364330 RepID=UPI0037CC92E5